MKDMVRTSTAKRLSKADLIVIDDIMLFPVEKSQAVALFNFINQLYENTCFIITTNKIATDWAKMLDDEVLATALLDRLLYRCEMINLSGKVTEWKIKRLFLSRKNNRYIFTRLCTPICHFCVLSVTCLNHIG
jgi:DNA replication protein DnaC